LNAQNPETMKFHLLSIFLLALLLSSCSPVLSPLTTQEKTNKKWSDEDLKKIQLYLSDDIVLQRKLASSSTEIISGQVKIVNGEQVEEVILRRGTPGVLVNVAVDGRLGVSFEKDDAHYLSFVSNPNEGGKYVLAASEWQNKVGKVKYEDKEWYTNPQYRPVYLQIDIKKLNNIQRDQRIVTGRKVGE
jgi:hypothetical protein